MLRSRLYSLVFFGQIILAVPVAAQETLEESAAQFQKALKDTKATVYLKDGTVLRNAKVAVSVEQDKGKRYYELRVTKEGRKSSTTYKYPNGEIERIETSAGKHVLGSRLKDNPQESPKKSVAPSSGESPPSTTKKQSDAIKKSSVSRSEQTLGATAKADTKNKSRNSSNGRAPGAEVASVSTRADSIKSLESYWNPKSGLTKGYRDVSQKLQVALSRKDWDECRKLLGGNKHIDIPTLAEVLREKVAFYRGPNANDVEVPSTAFRLYAFANRSDKNEILLICTHYTIVESTNPFGILYSGSKPLNEAGINAAIAGEVAGIQKLVSETKDKIRRDAEKRLNEEYADDEKNRKVNEFFLSSKDAKLRKDYEEYRRDVELRRDGLRRRSKSPDEGDVTRWLLRGY